jgi:hypothetical protein
MQKGLILTSKEFKSKREALIKELDYLHAHQLDTRQGYIYKEKDNFYPLLDQPKEKKEIIPFAKALQSIRGYQY